MSSVTILCSTFHFDFRVKQTNFKLFSGKNSDSHHFKFHWILIDFSQFGLRGFLVPFTIRASVSVSGQVSVDKKLLLLLEVGECK
jgi:hypothetical protein